MRPIKKKGKHGKCSVEGRNGMESILHSIGKEYGNYNMSLQIPE